MTPLGMRPRTLRGHFRSCGCRASQSQTAARRMVTSALPWSPWELCRPLDFREWRAVMIDGLHIQSSARWEKMARPPSGTSQRLAGLSPGAPNETGGAELGGVIGSGAANQQRPLFRLHVGSGERKMEALILEPSLYTVKAVIILDNDGDRLFAKYYDDTYPSVKEQKAFEKNIFNKTHRTDSEIALLEGLTVVYKSSIDLYFYVIGSSHENELMLTAVLNCLFDSLSQMLRTWRSGRCWRTWRGSSWLWMRSWMEALSWRATHSKWCTAWQCGARMCPSQSRQFLRCCSRRRSRSSGRYCANAGPPPGPPLHPKKHTVPPPLLCAASSLPVPFPPPGDAHVGRWGHGDTTHGGGAQCHPHPPKIAVQAQTSSVYWGKAGWGTDRQTWGG
uniref:Coatomer subunit zeta n=1 Tax=Gallus gallus TaxID=9031 RepID=A0A8V0ZND7_CHICK